MSPVKGEQRSFYGKSMGTMTRSLCEELIFWKVLFFFFGKMLFFNHDYLRTVELLISLEPGWSQAFTGLSLQSFLTPAGVSAQWEPQTAAFKTTSVRQVSTWQDHRSCWRVTLALKLAVLALRFIHFGFVLAYFKWDMLTMKSFLMSSESIFVCRP